MLKQAKLIKINCFGKGDSSVGEGIRRGKQSVHDQHTSYACTKSENKE